MIMSDLLSIAAAHFNRLRAEYRSQIAAIRRGMALCRVTEADLLARIAELDRIQYGIG
jgi:hypothetical protein